MPDPSTEASLYRLLPSLDTVLQSPAVKSALDKFPRSVVVGSARAVLAHIRAEIKVGNADEITVGKQIAGITSAILTHVKRSNSFSLRRVINATGVILHTNLGRAPLSRLALDHICEVAGDYSNLELDLHSGKRSRRDVHAESLLLRLLTAKTGLQPGLEDRSYRAVIVNNCAAATFLILNSLADQARSHRLSRRTRRDRGRLSDS